MAQMISNYSKILFKTKYTISGTQSFSWKISTFTPLEQDEGDISYNAESLFFNIPSNLCQEKDNINLHEVNI